MFDCFQLQSLLNVCICAIDIYLFRRSNGYLPTGYLFEWSTLATHFNSIVQSFNSSLHSTRQIHLIGLFWRDLCFFYLIEFAGSLCVWFVSFITNRFLAWPWNLWTIRIVCLMHILFSCGYFSVALTIFRINWWCLVV